jgi:hypothetical protein
MIISDLILCTREFEENTDKIVLEWKQNVSSLTTQIDQLSDQLGVLQSKLETLKRSIAEHQKEVKVSIFGTCSAYQIDDHKPCYSVLKRSAYQIFLPITTRKSQDYSSLWGERRN